jgi:NADH-quinone oxidoreductase subunit L
MLALITGLNLPVMFMGWEGVGLCSYLLIGYWYQDIQKANAGMKAFLVNRIGDAGFLIGIFLCYSLFNSVNFSDIIQVITTSKTIDLTLVNWATFFLFIGAMGKSAQIPLYVWLPDAMAGPTPVSALIHAATMVTAGIYMIVRLNPLFELAESTRLFIAFTGVATALLAAFIAIAQKDIKKVLAYSTVSQLGLMFLSLGVGQYAAAVFHLMTHAFFKALLFLGSGSVIHGLHGEQDIFHMGGLKDKMPFTYLTFAIGTIAIAGIPPLSGFFSKDLILYGVLNSGHYGVLLWILGSLASFITSFYMTRLFILTFLGKYRGHAHPHESPVVMLFPLMILAVGSALAGFLNMPHDFHMLPAYLDNFLSTVILHSHSHAEPILSEFAAMGIATTLAIIGMGLAWFIYGAGLSKSEAMAEKGKAVHNLLLNKFWVDEIYELVFIKPFRLCSQFFAKFIDPKIIDGAVLFPAKMSRNASEALSSLQEGSVQYYLLIFFAGFLFLFWYGLSGRLL